MSGDVKLEPCPFCGSDNISRSKGTRAHGEPWPYVECEDCGALSEPDVWNRRSSSAAERGVVEALELAQHILLNRFKFRHDAIDRALSSVRGEGGDKQATRREDAATAPISTDTKGTTK